MSGFLNKKKLQGLLFTFNNKTLLKYFFFFLISFSFWFLSMLSKYHETSLSLPVEYINFPVDKILFSDPPSYIDIRVKSPGFSILFYNFISCPTLILDISKANIKTNKRGSDIFWLINSKRKYIVDLLPGSMELITVNPSKILLQFTNKESKRVPVKLKSDITLKPELWYAQPITLTPDSITIYADRNKLDSIDFLETQPLILSDISNGGIYNIPIEPINGIEYDIDDVNVNLEVEYFIEETISYKLNYINMREGYKIRLFPEFVQITLRVSKEKYHILQTDLLEPIVDISQISNQNNRLEVKVINLPSFVQLERIYPSSVEFMLIKD